MGINPLLKAGVRDNFEGRGQWKSSRQCRNRRWALVLSLWEGHRDKHVGDRAWKNSFPDGNHWTSVCQSLVPKGKRLERWHKRNPWQKWPFLHCHRKTAMLAGDEERWDTSRCCPVPCMRWQGPGTLQAEGWEEAGSTYIERICLIIPPALSWDLSLLHINTVFKFLG